MKVLAVRQRQIQEKMELNRRAQEESIKYREQLIKELEEAKELTRREKVREEELKAARRQELEAQVRHACQSCTWLLGCQVCVLSRCDSLVPSVPS